jgi:hypothetical protein
MVKRAKLTLRHSEAKEHVAEAKEADFHESVVTEQAVASDSRGKGNLGKVLLIAGLTIVSLIIFKQKIF